MRKIIRLMPAFLLLCSIFACTAKKGASVSQTEKTPRKLSVWCWDPAFNIYAMKEAVHEYNKHNEPIELNIVETPWPDIQTKITTVSASGQYDLLPDIFLMQDSAFKKNFAYYPKVFSDLTASGIDFSQFAASKTANSVIDGKNYGLPFDNGTAVCAIRTDIIAEAGLTIQDFTDITWERYIELGKKVKAKTGKAMLSETVSEADFIMILLQSAGGSLFNADGSLNIENNEKLNKVIGIYRDLRNSGVLVNVNNWDEYIGGFTTGSIASALNGCWILGSVQTAKDQAGKWAVTNIPRISGLADATNYSTNGGSSWVISGSSKNKDLAIDFLNKTFAGSTVFYDTILPSSGAIATYLPAKNASSYTAPQAFFKGQKVYADILAYSAKVPSIPIGTYHYEARDAVVIALGNIINGEKIEEALKKASDEVKFKMGL